MIARFMLRRLTVIAGAIGLCGLGQVGCSGRVSLLPNDDPNLRRTPAQFAADAAKRTYPANLPRGGDANGRAQVSYDVDQVNLVNLSGEDWTDVEVWLNKDYVVYVPTITPSSSKTKTLDFRMFFDSQGNHFPLSNTFVTQIDIVRGGKVYTLPFNPAE